MLHIVKSSPFSAPHLNECLNFVEGNDVILFIQDGVITTATMHQHALRLLALDSSIKLYTLTEDLKARGLSSQIGSEVDYNGFVALTCEHAQLQTWG